MIRAYTGIPGSGKTSSMVYDAVHYVRKTGAVVFTNMSPATISRSNLSR